MPPLAILGGLAAAGSIAGGALSAKGAGAQADAATQAAQLQHQDAQAALDFQKQEYNTQQKQAAPWIQAGTGAINNLSGLMQNGGFPAWTGSFQAPTAAQAAATPGYQFQQQQGQQAIERSAAARGGLLSGGTAKALDQYSQGLASTNYQQTYNNALQQYQQQYGEFQQNQANQFNRLASVAGLGQTATAQLGSQGQQAANNVSNTYLTSGAQQANALAYGANARASGYSGIGNAITGGLGNLSSLLQLSALNKSQNAQIPTADLGTLYSMFGNG